MKKSNYLLLLFAVSNILLSIFVSALVSHTFIEGESEKAVNYAISMQQMHGLTILILLNSKLSFILGRPLIWINSFFSLGLILFCMNIYAIKLLDFSLISFLTPLGGGAFLIGWLLFMTSIAKKIYKLFR